MKLFTPLAARAVSGTMHVRASLQLRDLKTRSCYQRISGRASDTVSNAPPNSCSAAPPRAAPGATVTATFWLQPGAQKFEAEGARYLHVVDLDGAFAESDSPNRMVARRIIHAVKIPVQFGGGLRSLADVRAMIESGVERVVIGTLAVESPELLAQLVELFGSHII